MSTKHTGSQIFASLSTIFNSTVTYNALHKYTQISVDKFPVFHQVVSLTEISSSLAKSAFIAVISTTSIRTHVHTVRTHSRLQKSNQNGIKENNCNTYNYTYLGFFGVFFTSKHSCAVFKSQFSS